MINHTIKTVQTKLLKHQELGTKSNLSIFQVAKLMDDLKDAEQMKKNNTNSIFHSIFLN